VGHFAPVADAPDAKHSSTSSRRLVLVVMCVGYFLVLLDVTIVNTALPRIGVDLNAGLAKLQWVVDGYTIALAAFLLAGGTLGDLHGHKRFVLVGLGLLILASLGCGLSPTPGSLVAFRVLQGMGAAVMLPGTLAVITRAFPEPSEQAKAIGVWAGIGSSALVLGPLLGGVFAQVMSWRAVFLFNVPIGVIVLPVAARVVRESTDSQARRIDLPGLILGAGVLAAVTFAFIEAGRVGLNLVTLGTAAATVALTIAFVAVERTRSDPMLPLGLFRNPRFSVANGIAAVMNLGTVGLLFVFNLYLQDVLGYSALAAGAALVPLYVPLCMLAPVAGRLTGRVGPKWPMTAGLLIAATGVALLIPLHTRASYLAMLPALLLWGIGLGMLTPAVVTAAIAAVHPSRAGLASAVNNTSRQAFQAIGIAAFGALAGAQTATGFVAGFHDTVFLTAALYTVGALTTIAQFSRPGRQEHTVP
jgi:MFS transporter, DHA2 family, methylenomycin A resistance protein